MTLLKKKINLDLSKVPNDQHSKVKREVGNYLVNRVLKDIERGFSPVANHGKFKILTKEYAEREKNGRRTSNLQLEGDLKEAIRFKPTDTGIEFGNFLDSQFDKADGHNQHSTKAKIWALSRDFPMRRYIPTDEERFTPTIENEIKKIVKSFEQEEDLNPIVLDNKGNTIIGEDENGQIVKRVQSMGIVSDQAIEDELKRQLDLYGS